MTGELSVFLHHPAGFLRGLNPSKLFANSGFNVTESMDTAEWLIVGDATSASGFAGRVPNIVVYTHEPRYAIGSPRVQHNQGSTIYTFDLSLGNFADLWKFYVEFNPLPTVRPDWQSRKTACMVATNQPNLHFAVPEDLTGIRYLIAAEGSRLGLLDVYGGQWNDVPSLAESRAGTDEQSWMEIKHETISNYQVNFALENTYIPRYVSEKFWQSVDAGCLPVYLGSSWMDRLVDPELYIDLRRVSSMDELWSEIRDLDTASGSERVLALQQRTQELRSAVNRNAVVERWRRELIELMQGLADQQQHRTSPWGKFEARWTDKALL